MVDSVLLLVDAAEGPLPQTRYVLQKAMARHLPVVVAINKIDRGDARPATVVDDVYELFLDLGADDHQIDFPIVYTNAKAGTATRDLATPGTDLRPLLDLLVEVTPPPDLRARPSAPAARDEPVAPTTTSGAWPSGGSGTGPSGRASASRWCATSPTTPPGPSSPVATVTLTGSVTSLQTAHGIERIDIEEAGPGTSSRSPVCPR